MKKLKKLEFIKKIIDKQFLNLSVRYKLKVENYVGALLLIRHITNKKSSYRYSWGRLYKLAKNKDSTVLQILIDTLSYINNYCFENYYINIFVSINFNSYMFGEDYQKRNDFISDIIVSIEEGISKVGNLSEKDILNYFLEKDYQFYKNYYTPKNINLLIAKILTFNQNSSGYVVNVFDFACGTGSLLLTINNQFPKKYVRLFGQDVQSSIIEFSKINCLLNNSNSFRLFKGDSLINQNEYIILKELDENLNVKFDLIGSVPPFCQRWQYEDGIVNDIRFKNYGLAPRSSADLAFILHGLYFLSDKGTMAVLLDIGWLFREGVELNIRAKLIEENLIDTVISLPSNLFFCTGVPTCLVVFKKNRNTKDIFMIEAKNEFKKGTRKNNFLIKHVDKIFNTYTSRENEKFFSQKISLEEIRDKNYNLNPYRYFENDLRSDFYCI